jgi:hypothetical protein
MKYRILSATDKQRFGADIAVTVDYTDFNLLAAGNTGSLYIAPFNKDINTSTNTIPAGVKAKLEMLLVNTEFVFSDSGNACAFNLGDGGSATRYVNALSCISGAGNTYNLGTGTAFVFTSAGNIIMAVTGQSGKQLNLATAGSVTFWLRLDDFTQMPSP